MVSAWWQRSAVAWWCQPLPSPAKRKKNPRLPSPIVREGCGEPADERSGAAAHPPPRHRHRDDTHREGEGEGGGEGEGRGALEATLCWVGGEGSQRGAARRDSPHDGHALIV